MDFGVAPSLWLIIVALGAVALGFGLAYGMMKVSRKRDPMAQQSREQATRDLYRQESERDRSGPNRKNAA